MSAKVDTTAYQASHINPPKGTDVGFWIFERQADGFLVERTGRYSVVRHWLEAGHTYKLLP